MIEQMALQTAGAQLPTNLIGVAVIAFLAGMVVPLGYGMERLAGFARWVVGKLPYEAPPGQSAEEALAEATESGPEQGGGDADSGADSGSG